MVNTMRDVLEEFRTHPETKSADRIWSRSTWQTIGLLQRRQVQETFILHVGGESNRLDEVNAGLLHQPDMVRIEYFDVDRHAWRSQVLPVLRQFTTSEIASATGLSLRSISSIRNGHQVPTKRNRMRLMELVKRFAGTSGIKTETLT